MISQLIDYLKLNLIFNAVLLGVFLGLHLVGFLLLLQVGLPLPMIAVALLVSPLLVLFTLMRLAKRSQRFRTRATYRPLP